MSIPGSYQVENSTQRAQTITHDLQCPKKALAIGAHPDDCEYGAGATLAKWASMGCEIHYVVLSDGSKGTWDQSVDTNELIEFRNAEQQEAAATIGMKNRDNLVMLGLVDGEIVNSAQNRYQLVSWIRRFAPDVVLTHDPFKTYRLHPDHRNAGFLVTDSLIAARDPKFFADQPYAPHRPQELLLWEAGFVDHLESVASTLEVKTKALLAHKSQYETTMFSAQNSQDVSGDVALVREFHEAIMKSAQANATFANVDGVKYGEIFKRISELAPLTQNRS